MLVPFMIGVIYGEDNHQIYIFVFIIVFAFGLFLWLLSRGSLKEIRITEGFVITILFWFVLGMIGSIPFVLSGITIVDSVFESISGVTTTGATVLTALENLPKSLLIYRQLLQWVGGMGLRGAFPSTSNRSRTLKVFFNRKGVLFWPAQTDSFICF